MICKHWSLLSCKLLFRTKSFCSQAAFLAICGFPPRPAYSTEGSGHCKCFNKVKKGLSRLKVMPQPSARMSLVNLLLWDAVSLEWGEKKALSAWKVVCEREFLVRKTVLLWSALSSCLNVTPIIFCSVTHFVVLKETENHFLCHLLPLVQRKAYWSVFTHGMVTQKML